MELLRTMLSRVFYAVQNLPSVAFARFFFSDFSPKQPLINSEFVQSTAAYFCAGTTHLLWDSNRNNRQTNVSKQFHSLIDKM